jgi:hypothetical protein
LYILSFFNKVAIQNFKNTDDKTAGLSGNSRSNFPIFVRHRQSPVFTESPGSDFNSGRSLATLIFAAINHPDHILNDLCGLPNFLAMAA